MSFSRTLSILLVFLAVYWSFRSLRPDYQSDLDAVPTQFSVDRALKHVASISKKPHAVGFTGHSEVRAYIISELNKMGLSTTVQEGYTAGDWGNYSKAINILARIKGSDPNGKALVLATHYDSSPHSSLGASDAGSGVATILEGVRAFLENNTLPKNDIIVLITDAEELGLNGAELFVNQHPWAKEVGLVLNFEARGSGGPNHMLIETNGGNHNLIKAFTEAKTSNPVANSLSYSIYKMLPNDTDLTVFREDGDINGFNFAFIGDHFDYHTEMDNYERLDRKTLGHQGSYLMPMLTYFSQNDLSSLISTEDLVYFNVPFFKMVSYPFSWVWPIYGFAVLCFIVILIYGFRQGFLEIKEIVAGLVPMLIVLVINGLAGYIAWPALKWWYPWFKDMLHGFTYNGEYYILSMAAFALSIAFLLYHRFKKLKPQNALVAPIFLWLAICGALNHFLIGAGFFIIPLFGTLVAWLVLMHQKKPSAFLLLFLALPALFIFSPFVRMFPVGLGLTLLIAASLLTTFIYFLVLPVFANAKHKLRFAVIAAILFFGFSIKAHIDVDIRPDRPKPTSLVYLQDNSSNKSFWASYDHEPNEWNAPFLKTDDKEATEEAEGLSSKYGTGFRHKAIAPAKNIAGPDISITLDTIIDQKRTLEICVVPKRPVNRLEVRTTKINYDNLSINGVAFTHKKKVGQKGPWSRLVTHYISNNESTELRLTFPSDQKPELEFYEASNDLLGNSLFTVPPRPDNSIPMPFVLNDAIITVNRLTIE